VIFNTNYASSKVAYKTLQIESIVNGEGKSAARGGDLKCRPIMYNSIMPASRPLYKI